MPRHWYEHREGETAVVLGVLAERVSKRNLGMYWAQGSPRAAPGQSQPDMTVLPGIVRDSGHGGRLAGQGPREHATARVGYHAPSLPPV